MSSHCRTLYINCLTCTCNWNMWKICDVKSSLHNTKYVIKYFLSPAYCMDPTLLIPITPTFDPKDICIRYILELSLSFRHFVNTNKICFKLSSCNSPNCETEIITIYITNSIRSHKIVTHLTNSNVKTLISHLEDWRINAHDYCLNNIRNI